MKSNYNFWKHGLISLVGLLGLVGCTELTCDFSYSPTTPVAGESVTFSNSSTGADDYYWTFGDNVTSTSTSPAHIYKKPGTYLVTLSIVRNKVEKRSRSQYVTVIDTFPTLATDSDIIYAFTPMKFYPKIYNPWSKTITYAWTMPDDAVVIAGKSLDSSAIVCYFTQSEKESEIILNLTMGESKLGSLRYSATPEHREGISVLYNENAQAWEQFAYIIESQSVYSTAKLTQEQENLQLLKEEQDTLYQYGSTTYTKATVSQLLSQSIEGFQVDRLMGKIYAYNHNGLWVCNMTGAHSRQLVSIPVKAVKVDGANNRFYWATNDGMYAHRLMSTETNQETFTPHKVNNATQITRISVNSNLH